MTIYLQALALTILIETAVAAAMGYRSRGELLTVALINLATNPALNFVIWLMTDRGVEVTVPIVIVLELIVVIVEWRLLVFLLKGPSGRLLLLSLVMNTVSCVTGVILFR